ncbi:hypothetical protein NP233_g12375 [Leucocoprinus birnbaumii]|uniref:Uncharacterized protein n=1 Tax=Leucocoprinus birnbaumii TaxID=56174 RepID=A0AAD5YJH9_9AGAR|nr:hypothetical protein NP233_g12375 [Leucocoprinus birnbaumii]
MSEVIMPQGSSDLEEESLRIRSMYTGDWQLKQKVFKVDVDSNAQLTTHLLPVLSSFMDSNYAVRLSPQYAPLEAAPRAREVIASPTSSDPARRGSIHPQGSSVKSMNKQEIHLRVAAFICLEVLFLVFACHCFSESHPIPLQTSPNDEVKLLSLFKLSLTELKAGIAALSVAWHTLAGFFVKDIIAVVCSAEFMVQYRRLGELNPGLTDRVFMITSGTIDNLLHFVMGTATGRFRLAFITMLALMTVGPLGSGIITIGTIMVKEKLPIAVASLTPPLAEPQASYWSDRIGRRAALVTNMEKVENITFGYNMGLASGSDYVLIPWPIIDQDTREQTSIIYRSDILRFHFECSWVSAVESRGRTTDGCADALASTWQFQFFSAIPWKWPHYRYYSTAFPESPTPLFPGIMPLSPFAWVPYLNYTSIDALFLFINPIPSPNLDVQDMNNLNLVSVLSKNYRRPLVLDLPDRFDRLNRTQSRTLDSAVLNCTMYNSIEPAEITLSQSVLTAYQNPEPMNNTDLVGNFSPEAAAVMADDLYRSIISDDTLSAGIFLDPVSGSIRAAEGAVHERKLLPLDQISENLGSFIQSAGKAALNGIIVSPDGASTTLKTMSQIVECRYPVTALVASLPFLISFTGIIACILLLLAGIV